jgi:hypothetical protein
MSVLRDSSLRAAIHVFSRRGAPQPLRRARSSACARARCAMGTTYNGPVRHEFS